MTAQDKRQTFITKCAALAAMRAVCADNFDRRTGSVNLTALAEAGADAIDELGRLDDDTDPIWDWALSVGDAYERQNSFKL